MGKLAFDYRFQCFLKQARVTKAPPIKAAVEPVSGTCRGGGGLVSIAEARSPPLRAVTTAARIKNLDRIFMVS